jgi:hypothetical protein
MYNLFIENLKIYQKLNDDEIIINKKKTNLKIVKN